jgi:hypothetical protein
LKFSSYIYQHCSNVSPFFFAIYDDLDIQVLVICGIVFLGHLLLLTLPQYSEVLTPSLLGGISLLFLLLVAGECFCWRLPADAAAWKVLPFLGVAVLTAELIVGSALLPTPTTALTWAVLATFFFVVTVPLKPLALLPLAVIPGIVFVTFFLARSEDPRIFLQVRFTLQNPYTILYRQKIYSQLTGVLLNSWFHHDHGAASLLGSSRILLP